MHSGKSMLCWFLLHNLKFHDYTLPKKRRIQPRGSFSACVDITHAVLVQKSLICEDCNQFRVTLFKRASSPLDDLKKQIQTKHHVDCGEYGSLASGLLYSV